MAEVNLVDAPSADIIVIGSGFGGSVAAARLVEAGLSVILLERGPWRDTLPVREAGIEARKPLPRTGGLFGVLRSVNLPFGPRRGLSLNKSGYLDMWVGQGVKAVCTSNVGGGSHIWAALLDRPAAGFWDNRAAGLSDQVLEAHYDRVIGELEGVQPANAADVPNHTDHAWREQPYFTELDTGEQPPMGIRFPHPAAPGTSHANPTRKAMDYTTDHGMFGCPDGAKSTVDALYLLPALQKGLVVKDMHEVIALSGDDVGGFSVDVRDIRNNRSRRLTAPRVVMAAGTMNTNRLLLQAQADGGLRTMPALGQGFGANGDLIGNWPMAKMLQRDAALGTPVHGRVKIRGHEDTGYIILAGGETPPVPGLLRKLARKKAAAAYDLVAMSQDAADGKLWLDKGRLKFSFRLENSPSYAAMMTAFESLSEQSGTAVSFDRKATFTAHPMGGCRIGSEATSGVVNGAGEVYGNSGLFVADASIFPQPTGVPPSASIAAWASHVAEQIVQSPG